MTKSAPPQPNPLRPLITLATVVLVVAVLKWAQDVILPIALAALIAFLLTPMVVRLRRWGLPNFLAIITSVLIAFSVIGAVGAVVVSQLADLSAELPRYERNIQEKISTLRDARASPTWQRTVAMFQRYAEELNGDADDESPPPDAAAGEEKPVPVEVRNPQETSFGFLQGLLTPVLRMIAVAGIVVVFVIAMLFQREDLRDRFIQAVSSGRINLATQAAEEASRRVSRYLLMQLVVNATYGIPVGLGLYFIGIPNALLWGLLATLLRFIPFLGPWIAAIFPVTLAIAVDPGFTKLLLTLALFISMELLSNNLIELILYRAGTGISNLALLVAAVFWTWLWGPIGLFLSTPLTACILVIGKYVPSLRVLSTLLGSEPVLRPAVQFYQRMLAMDGDEMDERARVYVKSHSLLAFYNDVLLPALALAEEDRHRGALAEVRQQFIIHTVRELVEDLESAPTPGDDDASGAREAGMEGRALIVPAGDDADELAAHLLGSLLRRRGVEATVAPLALAPDRWMALKREQRADVTIVSALPPYTASQAARACRHLAASRESPAVIVGVWGDPAGGEIVRERLEHLEPVAVVARLDEALDEVRRQLMRARAPAQAATPEPPTSPPRNPAIKPLDLRDNEAAEWIDLVVRDLAGAFDVPTSLVAVVDLRETFWPEGVSREERRSRERIDEEETNEYLSPRDHLDAGVDLLVVEDVRKDERFAESRVAKERGIRFYAGRLLRSSTGDVVGAIRVVDTEPRTATQEELAILEARARELVEEAERRSRSAEPGPGR